MAIEIHIFAQINKTKFVQNNIYIGAPSAQNYFKYDLQAQTLSVKKKILTCFCSIFIGIVNGLFGAGGGMLAVPCLNYICGLDEKERTRHGNRCDFALVPRFDNRLRYRRKLSKRSDFARRNRSYDRRNSGRVIPQKDFAQRVVFLVLRAYDVCRI